MDNHSSQSNSAPQQNTLFSQADQAVMQGVNNQFIAESPLLPVELTQSKTQLSAPAVKNRALPKSPTLDAVLAYQQDDVVYRFQKTYGVSHAEAEDIFTQVKKWLWLANFRHLQGLKKGLDIDHPLVVIDEMWHNFVLFTKEYTAFCQHYFGYYLHHAPATKAEESDYRHSLQNLTKSDVRSKKKELKRPQYEYIYDYLGKDTFLKWYIEYPRKYSFRQLAQMHLAALDNMVLIEPKADDKNQIPGNTTDK